MNIYTGLSRQRGSALIISLALLLVVTVLGLSAVQSTTLEMRMAANSEDRTRAFQVAEYTLNRAKSYVLDLVSNDQISKFGTVNGLYETLEVAITDTGGQGTDNCDTSTPWLVSSAKWDDSDSLSLYSEYSSAETELKSLSPNAAPRFMIGYDNDAEKTSLCYSSADAEGYSSSIGSRGEALQVDRFTITVIGYGSQPGTRVRLQAIYSVLR